MTRAHSRTKPRSLSKRLRAAARNVLEIARFGGLAEEYGAPFDIVDHGPHHRLRRYAGAAEGAPVALFVPPLMLTAEIYDISPDASCVAALIALGIAPFVVDFGAPEREAGGMLRHLDDHVRAVNRAIARTRDLTGRDIHLCGYSQGGMFAYQSAAYLRGEGIKSIVTFGSPVDIHKNLLAVRSDITGILARSVAPIVEAVFSRVEGLPGKLTSTAFKLVSTRKEVQQRIDFLRSLHDRDRIVKREARRRFLGGEGFVAWPGPAFREFVENFVVHNRMLSGGFVVDGRTVSLADLTCPILAFLGTSDEIARPATIRAIADAAPRADVRFMSVRAGHFGIVVGSTAASTTWPAVATWIKAIELGMSASEALPDIEPQSIRRPRDEDDEMDPGDLELELDLFVDVLGRGVRDVWRRVGDTLTAASNTADAVRWQEPRLRRLARIEPETLVSVSRELARRAKEHPEATFFLWRGRAFSYADADTRVTNVARGLWGCGVRPGDRVGVLMGSRPSMLSACTSLGRLGAVPVVAPPNASKAALKKAFERLGVQRVIVDPERAESTMSVGVQVLVLGMGGRAPVPEAATDMEAIDPNAIVFPEGFELDPGQARDISTVLLRPAEDDVELRAVPITNHRWALSAIGAAAACAIKPGDTVCCAVPLHHPTGTLVSAGAALAGGARLALVDLEDTEQEPAGNPLRDAERLLLEIRRVGATVVFYAGEMLRPLLTEPVSHADRHLPVRIFAGSGMRPALAARLRERFGVDTMEFYAGTAHRSILADAAGDEPGSLGTILPGSAEVALVKVDMTTKAQAVDTRGRLIVVGDNEPGLLAVQVSKDELDTLGDTRGLVPNAFGDGDTWLVTNDVIERDSQGKHWFVDSLGGFVTTPDGRAISLRRVEDVLYALPEVRLAAAWETSPGSGEIATAFVAGGDVDIARLSEAFEALPALARPTSIARLDEIPLTDGFRPNKHAARERAAKAATRWRRAADHYELV